MKAKLYQSMAAGARALAQWLQGKAKSWEERAGGPGPIDE